MPTAAHHLIRTLRRLDVDRVFCVPGESYLPVLDALADEPAIDLVTCRHESGAGLMAVADAKMTDRPGVAFVSRGPGATNAALAVHTAEQDGAPMVLFIGQLPRKNLERGVFQKIDYERTFADMAKWVVEVDDGGRLVETAAEAFRVARDGTPGRVVISVPEDVFDEQVDDALPEPTRPSPTTPTPDEVTAVADRLGAANRPLLLVGGQARSARGRAALATCVDRWRVPVATSYKHQDLFDNHHPCFAGHLGFGLPPSPPDLSKRNAWRDRLHTAVLDLARWTPSEAADGVDFGHIVAALNDQLPSDAVLTMDAGNFGGWLHRHFLFRSTHLLLGAVSGAMGLGTPAAVAAALRYPARPVVGASSATADSG